MAQQSIVKERSYQFSLKILKLYDFLIGNRDFDIAKQVLRSGTSIGANIEEALGAQSDKEFLSKLSTSYKESRETFYWLNLLKDSERINYSELQPLIDDCEILIKMIAKIRITTFKKFRNNF
jgi:four helix bundle protein